MDGDAAGTPSGVTFTVPTEIAALRASLVDAEARLSQTRQDLLAARTAAAAQDAAGAAVRHVNSVGDGAAAARPGVRGGAPSGGLPAAPPGAVVEDRVQFAITDASLRHGNTPPGGAAAGDYDNEDEGAGDEPAQDWAAVRAGGAPARGGRGRRQQQQQRNDDCAFDDGFDAQATLTAEEWIQSFDIPRSVLRADGMPMPFTPSDPFHTSTFTSGSRDKLGARHWYFSLS